MLLDPGPIDLILDADFPVAGDPSNLAADAAQLGSDLGVHDDALAGQQLTMADGIDPVVTDSDYADLGQAASDHDLAAAFFDGSIGDVASNTNAMDSEIGGLSSDSADGINSAAVPDWPAFNDHGSAPPPPLVTPVPPELDPNEPVPERPPSGDMYDYVASLYRELLGRDGSDGEIQGWVDTGLSAQEIHDAFIGSDEYQQLHPEG